MIIEEIATFLIPQYDPIQIGFGLMIGGLSAYTVFSVWRHATPEEWEKKWNGGTHDDTSDDLDAEHGSVNDISTAVASTAEKMADIMPGILLILGLLGTFLGLGIALNKASTILLEANAGAGMDSAMANLMGMMEGLGTKFKTSTWGIIAFLLLKAWSAKNGYEEKRLRWCVVKMKTALELSREEQKSTRQQAQQQLIEALAKIDQTLALKMDINQQLLGQQCALSEQGNAAIANAITSTQQAVLGLQQATLPQLETLNTTGCDIRNSLLESTSLLQQHSEHNKEQIADMRATRTALEQFVNANSRNLDAIQKSATKMAEAAGDVGQSAGELQSAIHGFKEGITDVLGTLKQDLGSTINQMGDSFSQNMESISLNMANATIGISTAVSDLSNNVGKTMDTVGQSIDESMKIQKNAQAEFLVTSDTLNTNVEGMTNLVTDLRERILSGLKAVSESGRRMVDLDTRYRDITEKSSNNSEAIENLVNELKSMQKTSPLQPAMDAVTVRVDMISQSLQKIDEHLFSLKEATSNTSYQEAITGLQGALTKIVTEIETLNSRVEQISSVTQVA